MRRLAEQPEPRSQVVTTWWQGNVAAATWASRNVASVTENGAADITITFREAYQATPAVVLGAGTATNLTYFRTAISASSVRFVTQNNSGSGTVARNSSMICTGNI